MSRLRVLAYSVSLDGYGAGPNQSLKEPLGVGGPALHEWLFPTLTFQRMLAEMTGGTPETATGTTGVDDDFAVASMANMGAWILGRNMFSPSRGPWPDDGWRGWWGETPPYHVPVFVLTHHARPPLEMQGGTTFHFVADGPEAALEQARAAAGGRDVRIGGGAATIRQYLQARLVDDLHLAVSPVLLGRGESLLGGLDLPALGYRVVRTVPSEKATHVVIERR